MIIANVSIDLNKIDKSKIKNHENGARYYSMDIFISDEKDTYGQDVSVTDRQSKEERESKAKKTYLGNGKVVFKKDATSPTSNVPPPLNDQDNDLPF